VRLLVDENGKRRELHQIPHELASAIDSVEFDKSGKLGKMKFASKSAARRTILEVTGELKKEGGIDGLAQALKETLAENAPPPESRAEQFSGVDSL
jgi:hypothetical protein